MKKLLLAFSFLLVTQAAYAQATDPNTKQTVQYGDVVKKGIRLGGACNGVPSRASFRITTAVSTKLVTLVSGQITYICGINFINTDTDTISLVTGTGTNCATGQVTLIGAMDFIGPGGWSLPNTGAIQTYGSVSADVCLVTTAAVGVGGFLTYYQTATP